MHDFACSLWKDNHPYWVLLSMWNVINQQSCHLLESWVHPQLESCVFQVWRWINVFCSISILRSEMDAPVPEPMFWTREAPYAAPPYLLATLVCSSSTLYTWCNTHWVLSGWKGRCHMHVLSRFSSSFLPIKHAGPTTYEKHRVPWLSWAELLLICHKPRYVKGQSHIAQRD